MKISIDNPIVRLKKISFETEQLKESLLLNSICKKQIKIKAKECKQKFISHITRYNELYFVMNNKKK